MKNFYIEINGKAVKDYQNFKSAFKFFLKKKKNRDNVVNLYELKSHAFGKCASNYYILIETNSK